MWVYFVENDCSISVEDVGKGFVGGFPSLKEAKKTKTTGLFFKHLSPDVSFCFMKEKKSMKKIVYWGRL